MEIKILIKIGIIIGIALLSSYILRRFLSRYIEQNVEHLKVNPTNYRFLKNASSFVIFLLAVFAIFYTIPQLKQIGSTLFAGAGIFAAVLAFASQEAFSNIIGGIFIVIFKPFRVGDIIEVQGRFGTIEDITIRHTMIKNFQNERVIIPNSIISSETIINRSIIDKRFRRAIEIGISFDSDIDLAMEIILKEARNHPNYIDWRAPEDVEEGLPDIELKIMEFTESGITLRAFVWSEDSGKSFNLMSDILYSIKKEFDKNNITIARPVKYITNK